MRFFLPVAAFATAANAYFLTGAGVLNAERVDPIINPGTVATHAHILFGGSNLRITTDTNSLRNSTCTSIDIKEDKSAYWFPQLYFQWADQSFSSVRGGGVFYYLFSDTKGATTPFPDNFRMVTGDPLIRSPSDSVAQKAISFLCLDFNGKSVQFSGLPPQQCPSGVRAQITFPMCWNGKDIDSPDHKSHVSFPLGGFDSGGCDPNGPYPITLPRIFSEIYYDTVSFDPSKALNPQQPFVFAQGDPTGYGYHGDFINGWEVGVLQKVVDECHCDPFGGSQCCVDQHLFTKLVSNCHITNGWNESATGRIPKLPGNNPVQPGPARATPNPNNVIPAKIDPIFAYTGNTPTATGTVVGNDNILINIPTSTSPPAVSSPAVPTQPTVPPNPSTSTPVPTVATPTATLLPAHGGRCLLSRDNMKYHRGLTKRHLHRAHNAAVDGTF